NLKSKHTFHKQAQKNKVTIMQKALNQEVTKDIGKAIQEEKDGGAEWEALVHNGEKLLRKHQKKLSGYELRNKLTEGLYRNGFTFELINQYVYDVMESLYFHWRLKSRYSDKWKRKGENINELSV